MIIPSFVNFLVNCENVSPSGSIGRSLELEKTDIPRPCESAHEILDFIDNTDVASSELSTEETIPGRAGPPVLVRAVPHGHGEGGDARKRHAHQILLLGNCESVNGLSCREWRELALGD